MSQSHKKLHTTVATMNNMALIADYSVNLKQTFHGSNSARSQFGIFWRFMFASLSLMLVFSGLLFLTSLASLSLFHIHEKTFFLFLGLWRGLSGNVRMNRSLCCAVWTWSFGSLEDLNYSHEINKVISMLSGGASSDYENSWCTAHCQKRRLQTCISLN